MDRWEFGIASGFGLPYGSTTATPGDGLGNAVSSVVPLEFRLGKRDDASYVGGYFQWGFAKLGEFNVPNGELVAEACGSTVECSQSIIRLGVEWLAYFQSSAEGRGWFGLGTGWEIFSMSFDGPGGEATLTAHGPEWLHVSAGWDFFLSNAIAFGPYIETTVGQYILLDLTCKGASGANATCAQQSGAIENKAFHGWFSVGARASFGSF